MYVVVVRWYGGGLVRWWVVVGGGGLARWWAG